MNAFIAAVLFTLAQPQPLDRTQVELLLIGNTVRIQVGEKSAVLYFDPNGDVRAVMPDGKPGTGKWSLQGDGRYCISWEGGPQNSCTTVLWSPGAIRLVDAEGKPRGIVTQVSIGEVQ